MTLEELATAVRSANANSLLGIIEGPEQTLTIQSNANLLKAAHFADLIVAMRNGLPVRLQDVATVEDSFQSDRPPAITVTMRLPCRCSVGSMRMSSR